MNLKKITAAILSVAMIAGFTGCDKSKADAKQIDAVMTDYVKAMNAFYGDGILELTNWKEGSSKYASLKSLIDLKNSSELYGDELTNIYTNIAKTITMDYEEEDVAIVKDRAIVDVTYQLVDWKAVFERDEAYDDYLAVNTQLRNTQETIKIGGHISLEKEDGKWKIVNTAELYEVFSFVSAVPVIMEAQPTGPDTSGTDETAPSGSEGSDDVNGFNKHIKAYLDVLEQNKDAIRASETNHGFTSCGFYDIDADNYPELYFIAGDNNGMEHSSSLFVYDYNAKTDKAECKICIPDVAYEAGSSGEVTFFTTPEKIVVLTGHGEEALYVHDMYIYDLDWTKATEFSRKAYSDYDPATDSWPVTLKYFEGTAPVSEEYYMKFLTSVVKEAQFMLFDRSSILDDDVEFPLKKLNGNDPMSYTDMHSYLEGYL